MIIANAKLQQINAFIKALSISFWRKLVILVLSKCCWIPDWIDKVGIEIDEVEVDEVEVEVEIGKEEEFVVFWHLLLYLKVWSSWIFSSVIIFAYSITFKVIRKLSKV